MQDSNFNYAWCALLVEAFVRAGLEHVCISPGSRSTPLAQSAFLHPKLRSTLCYDERSAAFCALGIARSSKKAALVICTSGSAVANLLPAAVEAHADEVPLILLTADRPLELQFNGANQSLHAQSALFSSYARLAIDMEPPSIAIRPDVLASLASRAFAVATQQKGLVHLNCQMREPLAPIPGEIEKGWQQEASRWYDKGQVKTQYWQGKRQLGKEDMAELQARIVHAERGLLLIGALDDEREQEAACQIAEHLKWPVLCQLNAGLKGQLACEVHAAEQLLKEADFAQGLSPDCVLHLGGRLVTDKIYHFLREDPPKTYIHVWEREAWQDPYHLHSHRLVSSLVPLADILCAAKRAGPSERLQNVQNRGNAYQASLHLEAQVAVHIAENTPATHGIFVSSSMPIRDMHWYAKSLAKGLQLHCNRGLSGIDGITSTAVGVAIGGRKPTTLLSGDLAFLHDTNGLSLLKACEQPICIVVMNNGGGQIFNHLPIAQFPELLDPVMTTPHAIHLGAFAKAHDVPHLQLESLEGFAQAYGDYLKAPKTCMLEVLIRNPR